MNKIARAVKEKGADGIIITSEVNRRYAAGFPSSDGLCLITAEKSWFFTDSRYIEAAQAKIKNMEVLPVDRENSYFSRVNKIICELGIKTLMYEDGRMTVSQYERYREKLQCELVPAGELIEKIRAVKTTDEIEIMIQAQRIAEKSFNEILPEISTDITEKQLAAKLIYRFLMNGAENVSFDPIVVSGARSSMPHGVPTDEKIQPGFLTMDFGVIYKGYCSDTTRTVCVGKPTGEMVRVYNTVLEAQLAGVETARAGALGRDIDGAGRRVIKNAGYGEYFGHSFGHCLGLEVHEMPSASPSYDREIPAGAVISAEPGIYLPGKFGVRIEDVLIIREGGCDDITLLPKELLCI